MDDFRIITQLCEVRRTLPLFKAKGSNPAARLGLQYERRVGRELKRQVALRNLTAVDLNPWFFFSDTYGSGNCSPDIVLLAQGQICVVEIKLTWIPEALTKLQLLYCPVVSFAMQKPVNGLVICKNLTPKAPPAALTLSEALSQPGGLLHWPNIGHILWD